MESRKSCSCTKNNISRGTKTLLFSPQIPVYNPGMMVVMAQFRIIANTKIINMKICVRKFEIGKLVMK